MEIQDKSSYRCFDSIEQEVTFFQIAGVGSIPLVTGLFIFYLSNDNPDIRPLSYSLTAVGALACTISLLACTRLKNCWAHYEWNQPSGSIHAYNFVQV